MAAFNPITREVTFKIVFSGCGLGGKTTTLERLHDVTPPERRGDLVSLATESDRTLYFDFLPLRGTPLRDLSVRLQLFTVPGQVRYAATRKLVLTGADAIVFVADAQAERLDANLEALTDLESHLAELGRALRATPHVLQLNKVDLPTALDQETLVARLNRHGAPVVKTVATKGEGIGDVLALVEARAVDAYLASLPAAAVGREATRRIRFAPEGVGLAAAVRDWTEGRISGEASSPPERTAGSAPAGNAAPAARPDGEKSTTLKPPDVSAFPTTTRAAGAPPSSAGPRFSLAGLFPDSERTDVRGIEDLIGRGDLRGAVLACETLAARALHSIAEERGAAWLLAGLTPEGYRLFRACVARAISGDPLTERQALQCLVWAALANVASLPDADVVVG